MKLIIIQFRNNEFQGVTFMIELFILKYRLYLAYHCKVYRSEYWHFVIRMVQVLLTVGCYIIRIYVFALCSPTKLTANNKSTLFLIFIFFYVPSKY